MQYQARWLPANSLYFDCLLKRDALIVQGFALRYVARVNKTQSIQIPQTSVPVQSSTIPPWTNELLPFIRTPLFPIGSFLWTKEGIASGLLPPMPMPRCRCLIVPPMYVSSFFLTFDSPLLMMPISNKHFFAQRKKGVKAS